MQEDDRLFSVKRVICPIEKGKCGPHMFVRRPSPFPLTTSSNDWLRENITIISLFEQFIYAIPGTSAVHTSSAPRCTFFGHQLIERQKKAAPSRSTMVWLHTKLLTCAAYTSLLRKHEKCGTHHRRIRTMSTQLEGQQTQLKKLMLTPACANQEHTKDSCIPLPPTRMTSRDYFLHRTAK